MSRIDEILAKQKELAEELELAKQQERDAVLKDIKEKIKMFDFTLKFLHYNFFTCEASSIQAI